MESTLIVRVGGGTCHQQSPSLRLQLMSGLWLTVTPCITFTSACRGEKVLIAANLHNSVALMPHYSLQLLALLAVRPPGSVFLSIYESGSSDATGAQ